MVPAALRRLGTLGLIALWVLVSGGLLLLLALSVQNSVQYSKLQAWILLVNAIAVVTVSVLLFWTDDWHRESEWFSWSLQR